MPYDAQFPEKLAFLFEPARYKVCFGGRGGAKSWAIADALLILGAQSTKRILCAREIQKSIRESVHQLLKDRIKALGLEDFYDVLDNEIRGLNGTLFMFAGLFRNVDSIKSKEGIDIVWIEEARTVSKHSFDTLIPTIRKDGSEIWISFNPELDTDEVYKRFVKNPPPAYVDDNEQACSADHPSARRWYVGVEVNWRDNPWFPSVLRAEKNQMKESDPDGYLTVWEGKTRKWLDGAIYANELRTADLEGRITRVPYEPSKPVQTAWDLGESDMTAIWFFQRVGFDWRVIDYYQNCGQKLAHYIKELQAKPYIYGKHWLPHDADHSTVGAPKTIIQQIREAFGGPQSAQIVPNMALVHGINAARNIFATSYFDEDKCADGLNCLRNYQYKVDPDTNQRSKEPLHNWASHGADAFRYLALAANDPKPATKPKPTGERYFYGHAGGGWMG